MEISHRLFQGKDFVISHIDVTQILYAKRSPIDPSSEWDCQYTELPASRHCRLQVVV